MHSYCHSESSVCVLVALLLQSEVVSEAHLEIAAKFNIPHSRLNPLNPSLFRLLSVQWWSKRNKIESLADSFLRSACSAEQMKLQIAEMSSKLFTEVWIYCNLLDL